MPNIVNGLSLAQLLHMETCIDIPIKFLQNLVNDDKWAPAVEHAIGKLLNAFIVTDHKDSLLLRSMAREANYSHLQIIIYDFSRPR